MARQGVAGLGRAGHGKVGAGFGLPLFAHLAIGRSPYPHPVAQKQSAELVGSTDRVAVQQAAVAVVDGCYCRHELLSSAHDAPTAKL